MDQPSKIGDRSDRIRACDTDAWPQILPCLQCLNVLPQPLALPLRPPSSYFTLLLSFSLLIFGFCSFVVECGLFCFDRESSLSFWIDSLSLSLYNYSIYLPLFFFFFIRWCVTMLVSWCWWVFLLVLNLSDCSSCVNLICWVGVDGAVWCGAKGGIFELGEVKACRGKGVC